MSPPIAARTRERSKSRTPSVDCRSGRPLRANWTDIYSAEAIREAVKDLEVTARPNLHGVLFPARNGSLRDPANFGRTWRATRGDDFAWATPRTFRKGVATAVDHAYHDTHRAARRLGNTVEVARTHYIDMPETVPTTEKPSSAGPAARTLIRVPPGLENVRFWLDPSR